MPKIKPRSSRRAPALKDSDYDHEITLVDNADTDLTPRRSRTRSRESVSEAGPSIRASSTTEPLVPADPSTPSSPSSPEQRTDGTNTRASHDIASPNSSSKPVVEVQEPTPLGHPTSPNGTQHPPGSRTDAESAIDILYENERGGFLCGIPLFSSKALGQLDPTPWTNASHHPSPTSIRNAQVPDPSWSWAWPEWRVNHDNGTDEGGWEYSFMFAKKFSWHGPKWYSSFVRRRAWIRKRVKKGPGLSKADPHLLNPEYFTVQPAADVRRSMSRASRVSRTSSRHSRHGSRATSTSQMSNADTEMIEEEKLDIEDVETLLQVLRTARIDREKIEAVNNFLEHGEADLVHLQDGMHDIMSLFVFQASRKVLLKRLTEVYDAAVERRGKEDSLARQEVVDNLAAAVKHADEEVRKLEYWSDVKAVVKEGGVVGLQQGWDEVKWQGVEAAGRAKPDPSAPPPQEK